jgi:mRNA-degrading endonuclease RelE of RelBE toxin-antitoxin system
MVKVVTTPEALKQLESLPPEIVARMVKLYERLEKWPQVSGAKPLTASRAGHWRLRTGDYRLQFRVEGVRVIVEKVGHRDRFYER